jgi:hypothetical protein
VLCWLPLAAAACQPSFDIAPTEVPRLKTGVVQRLDGEMRPVPQEWEAEVLPSEPGGKLWVGHPTERRVSAEDRVRFSSPAEAGLAPLGSGFDAARGAPINLPPGVYAVPALWLREDDGNLVEIPLGSIGRVHVYEPGLSSGAMAGIVFGSIVAAGLVVAVIAVLAGVEKVPASSR